ncbi:MAG: VanW family protein [Clostridium sp.]|uniref:VanW family protein n=1 Tax=Clostridium sp. TaxID=1506 RepID=UPI003EE4C140
MRRERKEKSGIKNFLSNNKRRVAIAAFTFVAAGIGGGAYVSSIENTVEEWKDRVYPGVTVQGINISGKNREEAKVVLEKELLNKISEKKIVVKTDNKEYKGTYKEIESSLDIDKAVENAINFGKNESVFKQKDIISGKDKSDKDLKVELLYNDKKYEEFKTNVDKKMKVGAKNATIKINGDTKNITDEVIGKKIDIKELDTNLKENLNSNLNEETVVSLKSIEDKPKVTRKELAKIKDVIGYYESSFATSNIGRSANIAAAVGFVDGTVLMPGEEFSYDKATSTDKSKYHQAPVYINNKIEMDIGGGICQVSSALYRANMEANVRPTERHNHSLTVSYAKPSLDATVAWGYLDYKFKNPYDAPIYIKGTSDGKVIRFYVYGDKSKLKGRTYKMENEIIRTIPPKEKIEKDPTLEEGKRVIVSKGQAGYVSKGYQLTYENGKLIKKELVSTDTYATTDIIVKVGTKKIAPSKPTPVPEGQGEGREVIEDIAS